MAAHAGAVAFADLLLRVQVLRLVHDIHGQASERIRCASRLLHDGQYVCQRLIELVGESVARDVACLVPADLAGHEEHAPGADDAVAVAARSGQGGRIHRRDADGVRWTGTFHGARAVYVA